VVFTLPAEIGAIAYQNKAKVYALLFKAAADTLTTIAADPMHLGADIGFIAVLHTWGQSLDHHPHLHCIVPAGGVSLDGEDWIRCRSNFFLPVRVLSRLFRRLFTERLVALHGAGELQFFGNLARLATAQALTAYLAPLRKCEWVVYAKRPFAGPGQVLSYLARYTHRVAISNSRISNSLCTRDNKTNCRLSPCAPYGSARPSDKRLETDDNVPCDSEPVCIRRQAAVPPRARSTFPVQRLGDEPRLEYPPCFSGQMYSYSNKGHQKLRIQPRPSATFVTVSQQHLGPLLCRREFACPHGRHALLRSDT
jgi:Putative transposase